MATALLETKIQDRTLAAIRDKVLSGQRLSYEDGVALYRSPDLLPVVDAIQREISEDVKLGVLPKGVTVSPKYIDLSLIKAAKERLDGHGA